MANPLTGPSSLRDIIHPQFHQNNFPEEVFIKNELGIKLDKGMCWFISASYAHQIRPITDDQICRLSLTAAGCPLGPLHCPLRHTSPSPLNFQPPKQLPTHPRERERLATVCKHWLRGLCKKGDACEFLHEYNLRRMPECWWFAKYGYCSAGDECLYAHPKERRVECPDYKRGFCKLGGLHIPIIFCIHSLGIQVLTAHVNTFAE
jgi:cleavage and polyadenylation specificity factor subunit 4